MTTEEVRDPRTWGFPEGTKVTVAETHVSLVALVGHRAFKVKKAVRMPFLDFRELEDRRRACLAEVTLNRRLAADVYVGVRALVPAVHGLRAVSADAPDALEYAVEMKRFDERNTLAARIAGGRAQVPEVETLAHLLAAFHLTAPADQADGTAARAKHTLDDTLGSLFDLVPASERARIAGLARRATGFLAAAWSELNERGRNGHVREGHGDLRAEHVVLGPPPQVVDCVEFSREMRVQDVGADLAFLVMDLELSGRGDLAATLLQAYRHAGGDPGDDRLVAFFAMERALVRVKVTLLRAGQVEPRERRALEARAGDLLDLAERLAWRSRGRRLIAIAGPAASGKSTLAGALGMASGFPVVSSDIVRKRLAGVALDARGGPALYDEAHDVMTYGRLAEDAQAALESGSVLVDATFRADAARKRIAEVAAAAGAELVVVECRLPRPELIRRARARARRAERVSDASVSVALDQWKGWRPFDPDLPSGFAAVRTDWSMQRQLAAIADAADAAP